jgi:hypothetical protein
MLGGAVMGVTADLSRVLQRVLGDGCMDVWVDAVRAVKI